VSVAERGGTPGCTDDHGRQNAAYKQSLQARHRVTVTPRRMPDANTMVLTRTAASARARGVWPPTDARPPRYGVYCAHERWRTPSVRRRRPIRERPMRSLEHRFRPSSLPPVSDRELDRYAGRWVLVRGGKVVLQASSHDALISALASKRVRDTDAIYKLPVRSATPAGPNPRCGPNRLTHIRPASSRRTARGNRLMRDQSAPSASNEISV